MTLTFIAVIYALLPPHISRYSNKSAIMQGLLSSLDTTLITHRFRDINVM